MPNHAHSFLIDLLAAHDSAADFGGGLDPQLLELLIDRHSAQAGVPRLDQPIRSDGPAQEVPAGWPQIAPRADTLPEASHARR